MSDDDLLRPSTTGEKLHALLRGVAVIAAGVPSTTLIPLPLTQALTRRFRREEALKRLHLMVPWARFCAEIICRVRIDVRGQEHLPHPSRGHLYVSNHQSYVDIIVLMGALDTVAFLSKDLVRRVPVIGRCAYCGGTVFFSRGDKAERGRALEETLRMCHQSTAVVVFPEGTRSDDGELRQELHPRAMHDAWRRGLRVVPVALDGTRHVLPKTMDRIGLDKPVAVRIGAPRDPADYDSAERFAEACWGDVTALFAEARAAVRAASTRA
jgi:1-acyl-sn-glycerol-3-phosphate acyltransferase